MFELGIDWLEPESITCGAKILYYADACDNFAEHELDYILFVKVPEVKPFEVNVDEVKNIEWVGRTDLDSFMSERLEKHGEDITPWFRLLKDRKLDDWWKKLETHNEFPS